MYSWIKNLFHHVLVRIVKMHEMENSLDIKIYKLGYYNILT